MQYIIQDRIYEQYSNDRETKKNVRIIIKSKFRVLQPQTEAKMKGYAGRQTAIPQEFVEIVRCKT